jgi:glycosyltransferase involved in cell wall biosynthesis
LPLLSVVVPAFNASSAIADTLQSVRTQGSDVEVIVVDDGSDDGGALASVLGRFPGVRLVTHDRNRGMCAARNSGIEASTGNYVTILDADDRFAADWPEQFGRLLREWPESVNVSYVACRTETGEITVDDPAFTGLLTLDDILNERHSGEYLPIFRGDYIRKSRYADIGTRKSCGILSYIRFAQDAPFWVSNRVIRIYNAGRPGSVSSGWTAPEKARETVSCYAELFRQYGELYARRAPRVYRTKMLRYALYLSFARRPGAWAVWWRAAHWRCIKETAATFGLLLAGPNVSTTVVRLAKSSGLVRRYG